MLKLYLSVITLLIVLALQAQQPVLQWAKVFEEHNPWNYSTVNNGRSVGVDQQGNVYSASSNSEISKSRSIPPAMYMLLPALTSKLIWTPVRVC